MYCGYIKSSLNKFVDSEDIIGDWFYEVGRLYYRVNSTHLNMEQNRFTPNWDWQVFEKETKETIVDDLTRKIV